MLLFSAFLYNFLNIFLLVLVVKYVVVKFVLFSLAMYSALRSLCKAFSNALFIIIIIII